MQSKVRRTAEALKRPSSLRPAKPLDFSLGTQKKDTSKHPQMLSRLCIIFSQVFDKYFKASRFQSEAARDKSQLYYMMYKVSNKNGCYTNSVATTICASARGSGTIYVSAGCLPTCCHPVF